MSVNFYQEKWFWAMFFIFVLEMIAIAYGIDGLLLSASVGILASLGGYGLGKKKTV